MDQLFLLEILIERIEFFAYVKNVPQKKQINVFVGFGNIAQLEIRSETPGEASEGKSKRNIEYNAGKSYLFPCGTATMIEALQTCPLEISVYDKGTSEPVGGTTLQWDHEFVDMVESSEESAGFYVTPMSVRQTLKFSSKTELVGEFVLFLRLSCFGKNIQTSVQVTQAKEGGRMYLFKDSNAATTFQCQKYGMMGTSSDTIPVAPLYNLVTGLKNLRAAGAGPQAIDDMDTGEKESWFQLFDDATMSLMSLRPTEFKAVDITESAMSSSMTGDIPDMDVFALTGRLQENKYFDFLKQLLAKPADEQEEVVITGQGGLSPTSVLSDGKSGSDGGKADADAADGKPQEEEELTAERIGRLLCRSRDCPGALKFREFGIGPLATGRGLGTVYDVAATAPPAAYGMSQTYGVLDSYGAYGVFTRPRRPEEPYVPPGSAAGADGAEGTARCRHRICEKHRRALREGRIKLPQQGANACQHAADAPSCQGTEHPLRIKGGSNGTRPSEQNHPGCDQSGRVDVGACGDETRAPKPAVVSEEWQYFRYDVKDVTSSGSEGGSTPVDVAQGWAPPLRLRGGGLPTPPESLPRPKSLRRCSVTASKYKRVLCQKRSRTLQEGRIRPRHDRPSLHTLDRKYQDGKKLLFVVKDSHAHNAPYHKRKLPEKREQELKSEQTDAGDVGNQTDRSNDDLKEEEFKYFRYIFTSKAAAGEEKKPLRVSECWAVPLRLRAGGQLTLEELSRPKSPLLECRVIMEQFDSILQEYKKALGPCGQASCPYSPNLMEKPCLKECNEFDTQNVDLISCIDIDCPLLPQLGVLTKDPLHKDDSLSNCGAFDCPFKNHPSSSTAQQQQQQTPQARFKHLKNACGSLRCPYTKYKTGLVDDDAALELQYLPPAVSGKCGHPKCGYPLELDLPPIHWDCPEPLPQGPCKNPDCPYLPPDLRCLKVLAPKGPCGSPTCPYVTPPPCTSPQCPFRPRPCPYMTDPAMAPAGDHSRDSDSCGDPDCPFDTRRRCKHPACSSRRQAAGGAPQGGEGRPAAGGGGAADADQLHCSVPPEDHSSHKASEGGDRGAGARCGWKGDSESDCDDPNCPFGRRPARPCANPNCPYAKLQESSECTDSDCPFNKQAKAKAAAGAAGAARCPPPSPDCGVFDCPYAVPSPCPYERPICPYTTPIVCPALTPSCPGPLQLCQLCRAPLDRHPALVGDAPPPGGDQPSQGDGSQMPSAQEGAEEQPDAVQGGGQDGDGGGDRPTETVKGDRPEDGLDLEPCRQGTCKSTGGTLVCEECPCEEGVCASEGQIPRGDKTKKAAKAEKKTVSDPGLSKRKKINLKKLINNKKWRSKYVYSVGDKYPGIQVGHRECVMPGFNVPAHMGWLWNVHTPCMSLKPRRGWRPGAVTRTIAKRIHDHRVAKGLAMQQLPDFSTGKKKKKHHGIYESDSDSTVAPKPTLLIKKEKGTYFITMNPLKDPNTLADNENPYMDCSPMQFKITKNKKARTHQDEDLEYRTCYCEDDDDDHTPSSSSSSDSELDIEFTPPAGIIRPDRLRKKKNVVHCESQYDPEDCKPPPAKSKKDKKDKKDKGKKGGKGKKGKGDKKGGKGKKKKK